MEWHYPLLREVASIYQDTDLSDILLIACQHLLGPQVAMVKKLLAMGLRPSNLIVAGKSYSTSHQAYAELLQTDCSLAPWRTEFEPNQSFDSWFEGRLDNFVRYELVDHSPTRYRRVITLDDGGHLHAVCGNLLNHQANVAGVEQTSSGDTRVKALQLPYQVTSIARWWHKQVREAPFIGEYTCRRIVAHIRKRHTNPRVLICGLGTIGRHIAGELSLREEIETFACDKNPQRIANWGMVQRLRNCGRTLAYNEAVEHIGEFNVIIGATGSNLFDESVVKRLHPQVSLISVSSSDREFPATHFREDTQGNIHDDYFRGKRCLVNGGFPVTFYGNYHECDPRLIELTIAFLMIGVLDAVSEEKQPLPAIVNRIYEMWIETSQAA